ncbi:MAG: hypothetical protein K2N78_08615, partial [Oscillospiraceae bacterium]|nr:hypothetical protein [Oscillospiraceae bacterium]
LNSMTGESSFCKPRGHFILSKGIIRLYNYDFSVFSDDDINEYGYFGYPHIDDYWNDEGRYPFFIRAVGKLAGLVFVRSCCEHTDLSNPHNIAEFFVMKKYRNKGVG